MNIEKLLRQITLLIKEEKMKRVNLAFFVIILSLVMFVACTKKPTGSEQKEKYGSLNVISTPSGASIFLDCVDTKEVTSAWFSYIPVGKHNLRLKLEHYNDWIEEITIEENKQTQVVAELELAPIKLILKSTPAGAQVWINGKPTSDTTPATVYFADPFIYTVQLLKAGYFPWTTNVELTYGDTKEFSPILDIAPAAKIVYSNIDTLWQIGADGMNRTMLADNCNSIVGGVAWSPNGQYLAYSSHDGITILDENGTKKAVLSFGSYSRATDFTWSHSSRYLVFGSYVDGIYRYDVDTEELKRIFVTSGYKYDHNPVFSPNDSLIAFVHHEWEEKAWFWLMNADGSSTHVITDQISTTYDANLNPIWFSDTKILFEKSKIYLLDLEKSSQGLVTPTLLIDEIVDYIQLTPNHFYFAYLKSGELCYGTVNNWVATSSIEITNITYFSWTPSGNSFVGRGYDGIHWITLDGKDYIVFFTYTMEYGGGVSVKP